MVRKLTAEEKAALEALSGHPDLTDPDAPEVVAWDGAARGGLYRPLKRPVTMRLDADVLEWFRARHAKGYQTKINAILRDYIAQRRQDAAS
ncbi:MAG: BrnA antitoxin family protein [Rhodomicrobium sp.]